MDDHDVLTTSITKLSTCTCEQPLPEVRAVRKGAARTHCARCGLPTRIAFELR